MHTYQRCSFVSSRIRYGLQVETVAAVNRHRSLQADRAMKSTLYPLCNQLYSVQHYVNSILYRLRYQQYTVYTVHII